MIKCIKGFIIFLGVHALLLFFFFPTFTLEPKTAPNHTDHSWRWPQLCWALSRAFNLETQGIPFWKVFLYDFFVNFLPCDNFSVSLSLHFGPSVTFDALRPHGLQRTMLPCPSPTPRVRSNSCPLSQWWHPTISSSVISFSSCLQSFLASGSSPMSWFFAWGGQSIGVSASASVLPMNIQDWFSLGWTGWISLQS